jgi:hypothetical protein
MDAINTNTLRGEVAVRLGQNEQVLRFNLNAFRLLTKRVGIKLSALGEYLQSDEIEALTQLAYAAYLNDCMAKGKEPISFDQFAALLLENGTEVIEQITLGIQYAFSLGNALSPQPAAPIAPE